MPPLTIRKPTPINAAVGTEVPPPDPLTLGAPPMPPLPTSPAAGFQAWASDPMNQAKVPDPVPAKTPLIPTQQDYFKQHPEQEQTPLLMGRKWAGLAQGIFAAMQDIGRPGAGSERLQGLMQHDQNLPQTNAGIYRTNVVQPEMDRLGMTEAQNRSRLTGAQANVEEMRAKNPMMDPQMRSFYDEAGKFKNDIAQEWQSGKYDQANFSKIVQQKLAANPHFARFIDPAYLQQVQGLPQQPPAFKVEGGAVAPLTWRGQNYGAMAGENEPPEIASARKAAMGTLSQQLADKFGPEVLAQLGQPPIGDPVKMAKYGKDAEAIKTRMTTDPKVAAALARPVQVIMPSGAPGFMRGGNAIDSGATAASAGSEVNKYVEKARAAMQSAQQADAITQEIEKGGKITGPQAMTLLSLHVATTFGGIPGVGIGESLIKAHHDARSLPEGLWAAYNKVKNGGDISPEQAKEWVSLIHEKRDLTMGAAQAEAQRLGVPLNLGGGASGAAGEVHYKIVNGQLVKQ